MRRFVVNRYRDLHGMTGTGVVAEGVEFSDGRIALRWLTRHSSTVVYDRMEDVVAIHGHGGTTRVEFMDEKR